MESEEDLNAPLDLCLHGGPLDGEVVVWTNQKPAPLLIRFDWLQSQGKLTSVVYDKIDHWDSFIDEDGKEQNAGCYYMDISEEKYQEIRAAIAADAP